MRLDWWEEVPDLASSSNGFLFWFRVARVEGVCGVAPHSLSNCRFWSRDVPASRFPLAPPNVRAEQCPTERGNHAALPFFGLSEAHELLLLRMVECRCWFPGLPGPRFR